MTADGEIDRDRMVSEVFIECDVCFALIKGVSVESHRYWHRVSASPMGLALYLGQFPLLKRCACPSLETA